METLKNTITLSLLHSIFELMIPWPKSTPPTGPLWASNNAAATNPIWHTLCWPSLLALSTTLPHNPPADLTPLLPPPSSSSFPETATGLIILLDQAPRYLCTGPNERWRNAFFDPLALTLRLHLAALPPTHRLDTPQRWLDQGYSFEHWVIIATFLAAPYAHSEDRAVHHTYMQPAVADLRARVEARFGVEDALFQAQVARGDLLRESGDVYAFARIAKGGWPAAGGLAERAFHFCWLLDAHEPIVERFGRYPYRNRALGRGDAEGEREFLVETGGFGTSVTEEDAVVIKEDVERGVWRALEWME
ncbi:hypothetical protein EJ05DRAFT_59283 [Pseudovirgaria hyperparasitica]|uniref:DUF924-domain-containing protein n=1 Tax=Pseudovirgaria hyperparasitica TaxID=470096 RepID=A0A6A6W5J8_9PEZI|nr:uncharacterized protein EJ05DRAFT_59283 [Pseudovirgaria hyperparasitica]KAF2757226.1 hypothetical protein EJ05DRAFT_59283 [Pseudovirgaria hyperparasitica]